jgi:hypothetical protein
MARGQSVNWSKSTMSFKVVWPDRMISAIVLTGWLKMVISEQGTTSFVLMAVVFYISIKILIFRVGCINGVCYDVLNYSRMHNNCVYSF